MKKFNVGEYKFYVREQMPWSVYRGAQSKLAQEFGKISAEMGAGEMEKASVQFGLDLQQKVQDFYVPKLIKKVTKGDEDFSTTNEIQEIIDESDAIAFMPVFDYCVSLYEAMEKNASDSKKKK